MITYTEKKFIVDYILELGDNKFSINDVNQVYDDIMECFCPMDIHLSCPMLCCDSEDALCHDCWVEAIELNKQTNKEAQ
jgi:hypothetical protein